MATAPGVDDHNDEGLKEAGDYVSSLPFRVVVRMKKCPLVVSDDETGISTGGSADRLAVNMLFKLHPTQSLDIFCSTCTCQRLICRDCVVIDHTHENHDYDLVEKVAPGYKKALQESLNPVQETQGKVTA